MGETDDLLQKLGANDPIPSGMIVLTWDDAQSIATLITSLREALVSAREWLPCIEPVMFDTPIFKRDLEKIDAALNPSRKETI